MIKAVIDRFEEKKAVLLIGGGEQKVVFPKEYLPQGVREGDYLSFVITYDKVATLAAKAEAEALLKDLKQSNE